MFYGAKVDGKIKRRITSEHYVLRGISGRLECGLKSK